MDADSERDLAPRRARPRRARRALGCALFLVFMLPLSSASATYYSGGSGTRKFTVAVTGVNPTWESALIGAPGVWNASGAGVSIAVGPSVSKRITAGNYPTETWLGLYTPSGTRANRSFIIQHNANRISAVDGVSPGTWSQWVRWTTLHELGHALSLDDNPVTSQASIMKYPSASVVPFQSPRPYDIADVLAFY